MGGGFNNAVWVAPNNGVAPPPALGKTYVGRTIFVSTQGSAAATAEYERLDNHAHFNNLDEAIAAIQTPADVIKIHSVSTTDTAWTITADLPAAAAGVLNMDIDPMVDVAILVDMPSLITANIGGMGNFVVNVTQTNIENIIFHGNNFYATNEWTYTPASTLVNQDFSSAVGWTLGANGFMSINTGTQRLIYDCPLPNGAGTGNATFPCAIVAGRTYTLAIDHTSLVGSSIVVQLIAGGSSQIFFTPAIGVLSWTFVASTNAASVSIAVAKQQILDCVAEFTNFTVVEHALGLKTMYMDALQNINVACNTGSESLMRLKAGNAINLSFFNISDSPATDLEFTAPAISLTNEVGAAPASPTIDDTGNNPDYRVVFNGKLFLNTDVETFAGLTIIGSAQNVSDKIKIYGDIKHFGNGEAIRLENAIWQFANYSIISEIETNDGGTAATPIINIRNEGGIILKSCNLKSMNALRDEGLIITDVTGAYIQLDACNAVDLTISILNTPDVVTTSAPGGNIVAYGGMASDAFAQWYDPLDFTDISGGPGIQIVPGLQT